MLNKLLKRCMPWQQRGRWVRIYYDALSATDVHEISFTYPDIMTISVADNWGFNLTSDRPVTIIYAYITITHVNSGSFPVETNIIQGDFTPGQILGTKGYIDFYISEVEVIE